MLEKDVRYISSKMGDKHFLVSENMALSYREFYAIAKKFSEQLVHYNLEPKSKVLLLVKEKIRYSVLLYGVLFAGGVCVPIDEDVNNCDLEYIGNVLRPQFILISKVLFEKYKTICSKMETSIIIVDDEKNLNEFEFFDVKLSTKAKTCIKKDHLWKVDMQNEALILFTSGTTGLKKGISLTYENLYQSTININIFTNIDSQIKEYVLVPLTHSFGFGRLRCIMLVGGTVVIDSSFLNPVKVCQGVKKYNCNALSLVPAGFRLLTHPRFEEKLRHIAKKIKFIEMGSQPMSSQEKENAMSIFENARICMHYGLTEASRSLFMDFNSDKLKLSSIGKPSPNVSVEILDKNGEKVKNGSSGEIAIRGKHAAIKYYNDTGEHSLRIADSWFLSGDIGKKDAEGYYYFLGRNDETINVGGKMVAPIEIENAIRRFFPDLEFCVSAINDPNERLGCVPAVFCQRNNINISLEDILKKISSDLEEYKKPQILILVEKIPKTHNNKIKRKELSALFNKKRSMYE